MRGTGAPGALRCLGSSCLHPRARRTRRSRPGRRQRGGGGRRRRRPGKAPRPTAPSASPAAPPPARPRAAATAGPAPSGQASEPRVPRPPPGEALRGRDTHLRLLPRRQPWLVALPRRWRLPAATPCRPQERRGAGGRGRARIQRPAAPPPAAPPHAPTAGEQQTTTTWRPPPPPPSLSPPPPRCIMGWRRPGPSLAGRAGSGRLWLASQGPGAPHTA